MLREIILSNIEVFQNSTLKFIEFPKLGFLNLGEWLVDGIKTAFLNLLELAVNGVIEVSYWGCLFVGLTALFLYISGLKKAGKYVPVSIMIYFLLQILKVAIESVK
ncbi:hypothetical protein [Clostridium thermobutyricum]|uniref:Uncharacterized protein n=1 Tax=Clostridium thermobutyricum DSM 4928 TaxID=1121339 RepID=A0A1V4SV33_9CLOT|nr:hypothetical protein [Clostridium thermobutyricum]OPX47855.1 hypothetical protein CLTHE_14260 [Clostridium thermobutyricum DSM 4928]